MSLEDLREKRNQLFEEEEYGQALACSKTILDKYGKEADFQDWLSRGVIQFHLEQYRDAIDSYNRALKMTPNSFQAMSNKAICLLRMSNKAICLLRIKRTNEAFELFRKALRTNPDIGPAWFNLGQYFLEKIEKRYNLDLYCRAVNCFRNAVRIVPAYAKDLVYLNIPNEEPSPVRVEYILELGRTVEKMTADKILTL